MSALDPAAELGAIDAAVAAIRARTAVVPAVALVLGSGLGAFADTLENAVAIPYGEIPGFSTSTVQGHAGRLVVGFRHGLPVAAMQGRVHAYEGHQASEVVRPIRVLRRLGAHSAIITNASGSLHTQLQPGALMCINDHINLTGTNPLAGPNIDALGPRFPDMSAAYTPELRALAHEVASAQGIDLRDGVYVGVLGPSYETPAEIRAFRLMGGDTVGMSTVPEVIAARHAGMRILGIACVTNLGSGLGNAPLDHREVQEVADRVRTSFVALIDGILRQLAEAA
jgi:purine-nucleoside phosphorylase